MTITVQTNTTCNLTDYEAVSTTSLTTAPGGKTLTISTNKAFSVNDTITLTANNAKIRTRLRGVVASYNATTGALSFTMSTTGYEPDVMSSVSNSISTGSKSFITNPNLLLAPGDPIRVVSLANNSRWMLGTVTSYNATTGDLVLNITSISTTTGTFADWVIIHDITSTDWLITPNDNDTISLIGTAKLNINTTPKMPLGHITSTIQGQLNITNTSTTTPIFINYSLYGYGQQLQFFRSSILKIQGEYITIGNGNNTQAQVFTLPVGYDIPTKVDVFLADGTIERWGVYADASDAAYAFASPVAANFLLGEAGTVFFWNRGNRTITSRNPIPVDAVVKIPNIHVMRDLTETFLSADMDAVQTTMTVNWPYAIGNTGELVIDNERIFWTARAGNVLTITRSGRGSVAAAHSKGARVRFITYIGTSGVQGSPFLNISNFGNATLNTVSFSYFSINTSWFTLFSMQNLGAMHIISLTSSPSGIYVRNVTIMCNHIATSNSILFIQSLQGNIDIDGVAGYANGGHSGGTPQNNYTNVNVGLAINTCRNSIVKCDNIKGVVSSKILNSLHNGPLEIVNSSGVEHLFIRNIVAIGCNPIFSGTKKLTIGHIKVSDTADGSTMTANTTELFRFVNCQEVLCVGISKIPGGSSVRGNFLNTDINCERVGIINVDYDGANNTNTPFFNLGRNFYAKNNYFGTIRVTTPFGNHGGFGQDLQNIRFLTAPIYTNGFGSAYLSGSNYTGITANSMYWLRNGGFVPGYKDIVPFSVLFDNNIGDNGRVSVSGIVAEQNLDYLDFNGNTYLDQFGRCFIETAGDSVTLKTVTPLKSITAFKNEDLLIEQAGLIDFTVTAGGNGMAGYTDYPTTGGSGTGMRVRTGNSTAIARGDFSSGSFATIVSGEGYRVGDLISIVGGNNLGRITITSMPTIEFRIANVGEDITTKPWVLNNKANRSTAIAGLVGYNSNVGFHMHVRITANESVVGAFLVNLRMTTTNDPNWKAYDSSITFTNVNPTDTVEMRLAKNNSLITTFTGGGFKEFIGADYVGENVYFVHKSNGNILQKSNNIIMSLNYMGIVNLKERLTITVEGIDENETWELRKNSDDSLIFTGTTNGTFVQDPIYIGESVYVVRLSNGNIIASYKKTPQILLEYEINRFALYMGQSMQIPTNIKDMITKIDRNVQVVNLNVIKASSFKPAKLPTI